MKNTLRIPTKDPYAYIEMEYEGKPEEAIAEYNRVTALIKGGVTDELYERVHTFTGEVILYDKVNHRYKSEAGVTLIGGSAYKKSLDKPFPLGSARKAVAKKSGVSEADIADMWERNRDMSANLGTALHLAMEQWFKHRNNSTDKNYHLPKHPFLQNAVLTFPRKNDIGHAEIFVSDIEKKRVGQVDLLVAVPKKPYVLVDYKTDADIARNLSGHFNQLSFYAHILKDKGFPVETLEVWNYTDTWTLYNSPVLDIIDNQTIA